MEYAALLTKDDNDTYLIQFPDFEGAVSFGETEADALAHGLDALATLIDAYIKDRRPIPLPSSRKTKWAVTLPALLEAKVHLYEAMRAGKVSKSELGKRLDVHLPQVDRLLEMKHGSQLSQIEAALQVMGKRLVLKVEDAPARRAVARSTGQRRVAAVKVRRRAHAR